jgi:protein-tyrosine phosphatase
MKYMKEKPSRHLKFASVMNFRDIGGYRAEKGGTVAWRRVFRSGEFRDLTREELGRLTVELGVKTVIDLRSPFELKHNGRGLLAGAGMRYCNVPFIIENETLEDNEKRYLSCSNMGEFYLKLISHKNYGGRIIEALEIIAEPANFPLVFHCAVGKDRTGMLAAMLLSLLGVKDSDIIEDYVLSQPYMDELLEKIGKGPEESVNLPPVPAYFWLASRESMVLFLDALRRDYGSIEGYLTSMGGDRSLKARLRKALLA